MGTVQPLGWQGAGRGRRRFSSARSSPGQEPSGPNHSRAWLPRSIAATLTSSTALCGGPRTTTARY